MTDTASKHGVHAKNQTAFRLPEGLLARLGAQAKREDATMTDIVARALQRELDRCEGITTSAAPPEPVAPPLAPPATFKPAHALNCKCMTCKPAGGK